MKKKRAVEAELHAFLTSTLDGGQLHVSAALPQMTIG
jgi:hypothetical protein